MRHQHRRVPQRRQRSLLSEAPALMVLIGVTGIAGVTSIEEWVSEPSRLLSAVDPSCNIKGNVSIETGERICHIDVLLGDSDQLALRRALVLQ